MIRKSRHISAINIIILLILVISPIGETAACKRKKIVQPEWIQQTQTDADYYYGLGHAPIIKHRELHKENAKNEALNDIASQISVQIFSSNVLVTIANNKQFTDEYNSIIRAKVNTELEGFELVDSFTDKKDYWVLYRLSKSLYQEQQQKKRNTAQSIAQAHYQQANQYEREADLKNALIYYIKTLDAVKLYLNDDIQFESQGRRVNIVPETFAKISGILSSLRVLAAKPSLSANYTFILDKEDLSFGLTDNQAKAIANFPMLAYYSERSIQHAEQQTNSLGTVQFDIGKIRSDKPEQYFRIAPNINRILLESSADYLIRSVVQNMTYESLTIPIQVRKPRFQLVIDDRKAGQKLAKSLIRTQIAGIFNQEGYGITTVNPDYYCYIETDTKTVSQRNGIYTQALTGNITLKNSSNQFIHSSSIEAVQGVQLSADKAVEEAYANFLKHFENRYLKAMIEVLVR